MFVKQKKKNKIYNGKTTVFLVSYFFQKEFTL